MSTLETKFQQVIENNVDLVCEYNANDSNIP